MQRQRSAPTSRCRLYGGRQNRRPLVRGRARLSAETCEELGADADQAVFGQTRSGDQPRRGALQTPGDGGAQKAPGRGSRGITLMEDSDYITSEYHDLLVKQAR